MNEKLSRVRPRTLGQASRIPGVTPAAVSLINVYIEIQARQQASTAYCTFPLTPFSGADRVDVAAAAGSEIDTQHFNANLKVRSTLHNMSNGFGR